MRNQAEMKIAKYGNEEMEVWKSKYGNEEMASMEMKKSKYGNGRPFSATVHNDMILVLYNSIL